jgi:hypothetical protein
MDEIKLTPTEVDNRIAAGADVLGRLPNVTIQGYASTWPPVVREYWESYGMAEVVLRRPPPSAAAIDRMDQALGWLRWLDPVDARIVWHRANGDRWKVVCWKVGMARSAVHQHWMYALCVIAWRLNGRNVPRNISKPALIARTRAAE